MPDQKASLSITELPELDISELGQIPEQAIPPELEAIDLETLNVIAARKGVEVHKKRASYGVVSATTDVKGKTRLTAHIPNELRKDVQMATTLTNKRLSQIVEEALRLWMDAQGLRGAGG